MKKKALGATLGVLAGVMLLTCTACGNRLDAYESETPPPASTETLALEDSQPTPLESPENMGAFRIDSYTRDLTGFEGLPWGYVLPAGMVEDLDGKEQISVVDSVEFAGRNFRAERVFTPGENGLEMHLGQYVRNGYFDPRDMDSGIQMAVEDYNMVVTYLTSLYGDPDTGGEPMTAEDFVAGYDAVGATWDRDNAAIIARLSAEYGGMLMITFSGESQI